MKNGLLLTSFLLITGLFRPVRAQETLDPKQVRWTAPLSSSTVKTVVDAGGNVWALSGANTFRVIDATGQVRWTKPVSALTIADFTVDPAGQLLLIGLPATGQPVAERYDASQTRLWQHTLDSLSANPADADKLSITLSGTGSCIALGLNARNSQRISYYFIRATGSLGIHTAVGPTQAGAIEVVRPVVANTNEVLFGFNQPATPDVTTLAAPTFYRLGLDSLVLYQRPAESPTEAAFFTLGRYSPLNAKIVPPIRSQRSLPLLTNGRRVYAIIKTDSVGAPRTAPASGLITTVFSPSFNIAYAPYHSYLAQDSVGLRDVERASSRLLDSRNTLLLTQFTTNTALSNASAQATDVFLTKRFISNLNAVYSLKLGTAYSVASANSSPVPARIELLTQQADGTVLLSGASSGTLVIGDQRFVGSPEAPALFLLSVAPQRPAQQLAADQVGMRLVLPATTVRVLSHAGQRIWAQLSDSTFRHYDSRGRLLWEKALLMGGLHQAGADRDGNLYLLGPTAVNSYDTTGSLRWSFTYPNAGGLTYPGKLGVRATGGGALLTNINQAINLIEFDKTGRPLVATTLYDYKSAMGYTTYTPYAVYAQSDRRISYQLIQGGQKSRVPYPIFATTNYQTGLLQQEQRSGLIIWTGATSTDTYVLGSELSPIKAPLSVVRFDEHQYTRYDSTGKRLLTEVNTPRVNALAMAKTWTVSPVGTLFALQTTVRSETGQATTQDVVLTEYGPDLTTRNTILLGTLTQPTGQTALTTFELTQAYADGSLLITGLATGTFTVGGATVEGSAASPVRYVMRFSPYVLTATASAAPICTGASTSITARLKGFLDQPTTVELTASPTANARPLATLRLPVVASALLDTTLSALSLPIPITLAAGTYWLRISSGSLSSAWQSLTVVSTPTSPTVTQQGEELVATGAGPYQWFNAQNQPISGATEARFRPQAAGSYSVVSRANGCTSTPSAAVVYVITATEPIGQLTVYPNPATDRLLVRWPGAGTNAQLRLLDAQGRLVRQWAQQSEVSEVSVQHLPAGQFLLHLSADEQPPQVLKVIVQRP